MRIEGKGKLLRVFIGDSDTRDGKPLHHAIVTAARDAGLAGATVLHGLEGYGAASRIHTAKILRLSEDLPVVVEIVDKPERIQAFLPRLDEMIVEGLVTLEDVDIITYRHNVSGKDAGA
ncbi:MAG: DUF190 domain-containing protein [Phycisphaerae bacterium]|nr:DUF190 domain-containing protein [Phycisphaerae bacterium]